MELSHIDSSASRADERQRSTVVNPYAQTYIPPVGRLLAAICDHCGVGGTIRPRNRALADWAGYASAGHVAELLGQLACDGYIIYDRETGLITRLFDPAADQVIPRGITFDDRADSALIPSRDRDFDDLDAENDLDPEGDQNAQCMEDHVLVAATETLDSAARYKIPCGADSIPPLDHRAVLLSELGADAKIIADALANRPDLTLAQIRASWSHFEPRIRAGLCTAGAFFASIRRGQLHGAPPDPQRPLDPESYAADPAYQLGNQAEPSEAQRRNALYRDAHWRAVDLLGPGAAYQDMAIVVEALVDGATDDQALAELEKELSEVKR